MCSETRHLYLSVLHEEGFDDRRIFSGRGT